MKKTPRTTLVGALRAVENKRRTQRSRDLRLQAGAIATSVIDPIISIPTTLIATVRRAKNDTDFENLMTAWGKRLRQNPRAARFLAEQAKDPEVKRALVKIARDSQNHSRVSRRINAPHRINKTLNDRLRTLRRARGQIGVKA